MYLGELVFGSLKRTFMIILRGNKEIDNEFTRIDGNEHTIKDVRNFSIINKQQWVTHKKLITRKKIIISVEFLSDEKMDFSRKDFDIISMIIFHFKTFKDGTPFTHVKKIRKEFLYEKEIRASGYILPDQYTFLLRCGFDSVEIESENKDEWLRSFNENCGLYYQPN